MHGDRDLRHSGVVSSYIVEIKAVTVGDGAAVGYGADEAGREFVVALDLILAAEIATALDDGKRPIVAVEHPLYPVRDSPTAGRRSIYSVARHTQLAWSATTWRTRQAAREPAMGRATALNEARDAASAILRQPAPGPPTQLAASRP